MNVFQNISDFQIDNHTVVTIGTFDGVHKGHRNILKKVTRLSKAEKLSSVVLTFFPHPRMVLQPDQDLKLINTIDERVSLLQENGVENVIIHPFSEEFSRMSARDYVKEILVDALHAKIVVIGYDHRFGRNRAASIEELKAYGLEYDFKVVEISKKEVEDVAVSSTKVRQAITDGKMITACSYLKKEFFVTGIVIQGKAIGRTINYPTANLKINATYKQLPKTGVYITSSNIDGRRVYGMTNIGVNPTINNNNPLTIETYYLDFDSNLYGQTMQLDFHKRLRDEKKFESLELLIAEMQEDEQKTRNYVAQL